MKGAMWMWTDYLCIGITVAMFGLLAVALYKVYKMRHIPSDENDIDEEE